MDEGNSVSSLIGRILAGAFAGSILGSLAQLIAF
jgi:hypothetical protein